MKNEWLKRIESKKFHKLKVFYRCDNDIKEVKFDLSPDMTPLEVYNKITAPLWWDGNTQGVFSSVMYENNLYMCSLIPRIVSPSLYETSRHCDFELALNGLHTLRMNRYYAVIDESAYKLVSVGGSVGMPTGEYGRSHQNGQEVLFGNKVTV